MNKIVSVVFCVSVGLSGMSAQDLEKVRSSVEVDARVAQIFNQCFRRSEGVTPTGVRITWRATASQAEIDEVRGFGEDGIRALRALLVSKNPGECQLAVRFLGNFEQTLVLRTMVDAAENPNVSPGCRSSTLLWLRDAPPAVLEPLLTRSIMDPDIGVRTAARAMLNRLNEQSATSGVPNQDTVK